MKNRTALMRSGTESLLELPQFPVSKNVHNAHEYHSTIVAFQVGDWSVAHILHRDILQLRREPHGVHDDALADQPHQHIETGVFLIVLNHNFITTIPGQVLESGLSWAMVLYGEEEEEMMQRSTDPVIRRIWDEKIVEEYAPTPKVSSC